jgi:hypothetical protein
MSSNTRICLGGTVKVCTALPQAPVKQRYRAVTVAVCVAEGLKTLTSEWKKVGGAPCSDAAAGKVTGPDDGADMHSRVSA